MKHISQKHWKGGIFVLVIALITISTVQSDNYLMTTPTFFKPCDLNDSNNGKCLDDLLQALFINWSGDIPGATALTPIDPLKLKKIHIDQTNSAFTLNVDMHHIISTGLAKTTISDASIQNGDTFKYTLNIPKFHNNGEYTMKSKILALNIDAVGPFTIDMSDLVVSVAVKTETIERDGHKFFQVKKLKADLKSVGEIHMRFDNLFGENQDELTNSTNDVFNSDRGYLIELMTPVAEETMNAFIFQHLNKIFKRIPASYIFTNFNH